MGPAASTQAALATRALAWGPAEMPLGHAHAYATPPDHGYPQILARSLIRAQLGLSLLCLALALAMIASFPILYGVLPAAVKVAIFGLPLTLIALGIGVFPVMLLIGYFYVRQAERLERQFAELVRRVDGPGADG